MKDTIMLYRRVEINDVINANFKTEHSNWLTPKVKLSRNRNTKTDNPDEKIRRSYKMMNQSKKCSIDSRLSSNNLELWKEKKSFHEAFRKPQLSRKSLSLKNL